MTTSPNTIRNFTRALVVLTLLGASQAAPDPAPRYAHGSTSLLGGATLSAGLFAASGSGTAFQAVTVGAGIALRHVFHPGFTLEPRLALDTLLATGASGLYAVLAARAGLGAGWAFSLGRRVAVTPMLAYEATFVGGGVNGGRATSGAAGERRRRRRAGR